MFKLAEKPSVKWPVSVQVPQDGGTVKAHTFDAEFALLPQQEIDQAVIASRSEDYEADLLDRVLIGWSGIKDENGEIDVAFNDESKRRLLSISYVRNGLIRAFFEASAGKAAARKN